MNQESLHSSCGQQKIVLTGREHFCYYTELNELCIKQHTVGLNQSCPRAENLVGSVFLFSITVMHQVHSIKRPSLRITEYT